MTAGIKCKLKDEFYTREGCQVLSFEIEAQDKTVAAQILKDREKPLLMTLKPYRRQRSLEQNKLMWALLEKLNRAEGGRDTEECRNDLYCRLLSEVGAKYDDLAGLAEVYDSLREVYRAVRIMGDRTINGKALKVYRCYHGSSKFDTKEMTNFIDTLFDRLSEYGIYDPEVESWYKEWQGKC